MKKQLFSLAMAALMAASRTACGGSAPAETTAAAEAPAEAAEGGEAAEAAEAPAAADGLAGNPMTGAQQGMNNMNQMGGQMGMNQMGGQMGGMNQMGGQMGMNQMGGMNQMQSSAWICPYCGTQNEGNNCTGCGQARG